VPSAPIIREKLKFNIYSQEKLSAVLAFDKFVNNVKAHAIMARAFAFYFKGIHLN
jgi:hypothetical protein